MEILLLPFKIIWELTAFILRTGGRLLALLLGAVLMIVGVVLSLTGIGACLGIPLVMIGFALVMRGLF